VDPVPDPIRFRKYGSAGNRTRISGSVTTRPQRRSITNEHLVQKKVLKVKLKGNLLRRRPRYSVEERRVES
jgi:hypothetical protein